MKIIQTKMGGLVALFPSFSVSCSCLLFFDILSRSIYLIFIVPSISPSYFSLFVLIFLSVDLLFFHVLFIFSPPDFSFPLFVFIPRSIPLPSIANTLSVTLFFNIFIPAGPTWKNFTDFFPSHLDMSWGVCVLTMYAHLVVKSLY